MPSLRTAIFLFLAIAQIVPEAAAATVRADGLSLELHVDAATLRRGPAIEIFVAVQNTGSTDVSLRSRPQWMARCGLSLKITSAEGSAVIVPDDDGDCTNEGARAGFPLAAESAVAISRTLARDKYFATPGTYVVSVVFNERGTNLLVSEPVSVVIR